ncbi:DUF3515 domain-containing protein [Mycobacterium sp. DL592]|uniref:DUF3515 domain-containing protein n=1 Tax=Mycobacterium sp. DL592 TaxID=2675524 RepID=UPI00141FBF43|nr:DUF3515 domain-containing protein [Mycobacterium sp. DL592]
MPTEPLPAADEADISDGPPRAVLIAALVVAVIAIGAVLAIAATRSAPTQPVAIASVPAPRADSADCHALIDVLPARLGDADRAAAMAPAPAGTAAWRAGADGDAVILRCGIDRPAEFVVGSPIQMVNQVQWFRLDDSATDRSTWVSVDRPVYVALTLPSGSGPTPIQAVSDLIARTLPAVAIRPGAAR